MIQSQENPETNTTTEGWKDKQMDWPYFIGHIQLLLGVHNYMHASYKSAD